MIRAIRSGELMVTGIEGDSEEEVEFIDAFFPTRDGGTGDMQVLDTGRIVLPTRDLDEFISEAKRGGLEVEVTEGV